MLDLCLAQSQELNSNSEGGISVSRTENASVKLLQGLRRARKLISVSKLSSYSFHSDQVAPGRMEKLIV